MKVVQRWIYNNSGFAGLEFLASIQAGNGGMGSPASGGRRNNIVEVIEQPALDEVIRRIVEVAKPDTILLFGSAARGDLRPDSDIDLLVVKRGAFHRGRLTEDIYMHLFGVGQAVDVIVVTPEDVERHRDNFASIICPAVEEGKVVYAA